METSRAEGRRDLKGKKEEATAMMHQEEEEEDEEEEDDEQDVDFELRFGSDEKKKRVPSRRGFSGGTSGVSSTTCQVENCSANMSYAKQYHRRHKVCELHAKAALVLIDRIQQRFCQQCSRFHAVSEFDGAKRSCRRRLLGHNERRRKNSSEIFHG